MKVFEIVGDIPGNSDTWHLVIAPSIQAVFKWAADKCVKYTSVKVRGDSVDNELVRQALHCTLDKEGNEIGS